MSDPPDPRFARVAAMIGDPTRAPMLAALLDGSLQTAGEIARGARVTAQTASAHLAKLSDSDSSPSASRAGIDISGWPTATSPTRSKRSRSSPSRRRTRRIAGRWSQPAIQPLRHARTCYASGRRLRRAPARRAGRARRLHGRRGRHVVDERVVAGSATSGSTPNPACGDAGSRLSVRRLVRATGPLRGAAGRRVLDHFVEARWLTRIAGSRALAVNPVTVHSLDRFLGPPRR